MPPNDPRFLSITQDEIEAEFWAHHYVNNPPAEAIPEDEEEYERRVKHMLESDDWEEVV